MFQLLQFYATFHLDEPGYLELTKTPIAEVDEDGLTAFLNYGSLPKPGSEEKTA